MSTSETIQKYAGAILKGGFAGIPYIGGLIVEVINVTIPDKRLKRIDKLLNKLSLRVSDIEDEQLKQKFNSDDFTDIFEEVLAQSIKAHSDQRLEYLASILEDGIRQEQIEFLQVKRLLEILDEINDVEVILLQSYEEKNQSNIFGRKNLEEKNQNDSEEFRRKHSSVFDTSKINPEKASEHKVMLNNYTSHLINLGLIGKLHSARPQLHITKLGVMLLKKIGVKHDQEMLTGEPINAIDAINSAIDELEQKEKRIRRELEEDTKKAKTVIERTINDFKSQIRRHNSGLL